MLTLASLPTPELLRRLRGGGLRLRTGPVAFSIRSEVPEVLRGLQSLYGEHPVEGQQDFADFHVAVDRVSGLRRWIRPQLHFGIDGARPFSPLPGDQGLPMLEWGMNWCVSGLCQQFLILHAAVLERNGRALVMPAPSGSGKSTLCAALVFHGWRLLSDELALIRPVDAHLVPMPRPVSLKNASIEVIQRFAGQRVRFASVVRDTVKGTVGHFAPPPDSVRRAQEPAMPGWVVFPRYVAGAPAAFTPLTKARTVLRLVENAFNYNVQREAGFDALGELVAHSQCADFSYGDLDQAMVQFDALAAGVSGQAVSP